MDQEVPAAKADLAVTADSVDLLPEVLEDRVAPDKMVASVALQVEIRVVLADPAGKVDLEDKVGQVGNEDQEVA